MNRITGTYSMQDFREISTILFLFLLVLKSTNLNSKNINNNLSLESTYPKKCIFSYIPPQERGPMEKYLFYTLSGWYNKIGGNTNTLNSNLETELEINNNITSLVISYSTFYGRANDERNENRGIGIIKFDHYILPRIELFIFSQSEYNKMTFLEHRNNSGAGGKFIFFYNPILKLDLSNALVYQYENYEIETHTTEYRWSLRFRIRISPIEHIECSYVYFYIPKIDNYGHYRTELETYMSYIIDKYLSFKIGYINQYNKNALQGIKKTDKNFYTQISLQL